jgi:hypothetical protein
MSDWVVALYGSQARGEGDTLSDLDVLAVGTGATIPPLISQSPNLSVSKYSWDEFSRMAAYGSLFLKHLQLESCVLLSSSGGLVRYWDLLSRLGTYRLVDRDIHAFLTNIDDVLEAVTLDDSTPEFELSVLSTAIRHASILGCYLISAADFGRTTAVARFCAARGLSERISIEFSEIYRYRLSLARGLPSPGPAHWDDVLLWAERAREVVQEVASCSTHRLHSIA